MLKSAKRPLLTEVPPSHETIFVEHYERLMGWALRFTKYELPTTLKSSDETGYKIKIEGSMNGMDANRAEYKRKRRHRPHARSMSKTTSLR